FELAFDHEVSGMIGYPGDQLATQKIAGDYRRALEVDEASLKIQPDDVHTLHGYTANLRYLRDLIEPSNPQEALKYYEHGLEINRKLTQKSTEIQYLRSVAISYSCIADVYADLSEYVKEVENNRKGLEIYEEISRTDPKNALLRQGLAIAY